MDENQDADWARRLRPIVLGPTERPVGAQLRTRLGVTVVASALLAGMALFFLVVFAGFEQARLGVGVAAVVGLPLVPIWVRHVRLRRAVAAFGRFARE